MRTSGGGTPEESALCFLPEQNLLSCKDVARTVSWVILVSGRPDAGRSYSVETGQHQEETRETGLQTPRPTQQASLGSMAETRPLAGHSGSEL